MSKLVEAQKVYFFISALFDKNFFQEETIIALLDSHFKVGVIFKNDFFPMKDYYSKEMGDVQHLDRLILLSTHLEPRENLLSKKLWTTKLEEENLVEAKRKINLDIGYVSLENVVLATGKQFAHRIYLGHGVYTDLNLIFEHDSFLALNWTYPDYANPDFILFFNWARTHLNLSLKNT